MSRLDLNLVRVFVAIYDAGSVTQAADRLALTQSTLSYSLSKLRDAYSDRLFLRGNNGLIPTALAEQLYEKFSHALAAVEGTLEHGRQFDPKQSTRRFRLAMSDIGVLYFTPPLLRRFQESAPHIEIEIVQLAGTTIEDLMVGRLDMAVGNIPTLEKGTHSTLLFTERYMCLMSTDHPTIRKSMPLDKLIAGRHILVSSPHSGHRLIDEVLREKGVVRKIVARVPHFTVLPQLLAQSDLLVILPSRVARLYVSLGGLKALELPVTIPEFEVRVHFPANRESSPAHKWLVNEIVQTVGKL